MDHVAKLEKAPLGKLVFSMCTHASLALLVYSFYTLTDTFIIARGVNVYAAGAVSVASPLLMLLLAFSTTAGAGGASLISRGLGKEDQSYPAKVAANIFVCFWGLALVITSLGLTFLDPLLRLLGATGELYPYAREYSTVILAGAVTSTAFSSLVRAEGATTFALCLWVVPVAVNLILDVIFVFPLNMGVTGAALATVAAQITSVCMSIWFFFVRKGRAYRIKGQDFQISPSIIREVAVIGFPSLLNQISSSILVIVLNRMLGATGGEPAITAFAFAVRIQTFLLLPQNGIAQGIQPIIGYNFTRENIDRVKKTINIAFSASIIYGVVIVIFGILIRQPLMEIFTDDSAIISTGSTVLLFMLMAMPIRGYSPLISACYQSIGDARKAILLPTLGFCAIQFPVLMIMSRLGGLSGVFWSFFLSDILIFALAFSFGGRLRKLGV
ncbi:putative efflux protein, MATE family [Evansella caseinilytica]|uniref:Multidrug export protein MepA n=1 Tax=Evansella caseinilytica TaxID=1503961 RepID=A0A1H3I096_9BACI|nr:MATE family efflux transporter [Evansella caseinilytica]SDY20875.1 putative efflux protein, MATE family [Evansella caseinilytica]